MGLQLIIGNSGSGKTQMLYENIIQRSLHEDRKFYTVVPEQFTMETQRTIVELSGERQGTTKIDIVSFNRLAKRVFDEAGLNQLEMLDDTGKSLLIRKVVEQNKKDFRIFGSKTKMNGFVSEMKSMISELYQYGIVGDKFDEMLSMTEGKPLLHAKLQDVDLVRKKLKEYMQEKYIMDEEMLGRVSMLMDDSKIINDSVISFDEYTGFSPVQYEVIRKLLKRAKDVYVTITLRDGEHIDYSKDSDLDVFGIAIKTIRKLKDIANEEKVEIYSDMILTENKRQKDKKGLLHLEQNIFRTKVRPAHAENQISIHACDNPIDEITYLAYTIHSLINQGYRYKDIAVITTDIEEYHRYIEEIFKKYQIPAFIDDKSNVMANPMVESIRAFLDIIGESFSYESVFRFLRCGMTDLERDEIDVLENYVIKNGIRSKKKWTQTFEEENDEYDLLRQRVLNLIMPVYEVFKEKRKISVQDALAALTQLIEELKMNEQLEVIAQKFEQMGKPSKANEIRQTYDKIMELFERTTNLIGDEKTNAKELLLLLEAGFEDIKVSSIPPTLDRVVVGDLIRTRLNHVKVLFVIGANDGLIPQADSGNGVLTRQEREFLYNQGVELSPTVRENAFIQKYYLYLILTKMSDRLYISYKKSTADGEAMRASYIVHTIQKMYTDLQILDESVVEEDTLSKQITNKETALAFVCKNVNDFVQGKLSQDENKVFCEIYKELKLAGVDVEDMVSRVLDHRPAGKLDEIVARVLYGKNMKNSVSRLETYAQCAYKHFVEYGLSLVERRNYEVYSDDIGKVYHKTMELFFKKVKDKNIHFEDVNDDVRTKILKESIGEAVGSEENGEVFHDTGRNSYLLERIEKISDKTLQILLEQIQAGEFVPSEFEIQFSPDMGYDNMKYILKDGNEMNIRGVIDRIDYYDCGDEIYIKIIDYKTSDKKFKISDVYNGIQLQLSVYMDAAIKHAQKKYPNKKIVPGGMFYYGMEDVDIDEEDLKLTDNSEENEKIIKKERMKKKRINGVVNESMQVLKAFDRDMQDIKDQAGESLFVPVTFKKDGGFTKSSKQLTIGDMNCLLSFTHKKVGEFGQEILDGSIEVNPKYTSKQYLPCTYCEYSGICGFEDKLANYTRISSMDDSEALKMMREYNNDEKENHNDEKENHNNQKEGEE